MKEEFIKFLKSKRKFAEYMRELEKCRDEGFDVFLKYTARSNWVSAAFFWPANTVELWSKISDEWVKIVEK